MLLKQIECKTGKHLVFEVFTKEKRSSNSTGNLGQRTSSYFRANSLYASKLMNQTTTEGFIKANSQQPSKSESKAKSNEVFANMNPIARRYLEQIERTYSKRTESTGQSTTAKLESASSVIQQKVRGTSLRDTQSSFSPQSRAYNPKNNQSVLVNSHARPNQEMMN